MKILAIETSCDETGIALLEASGGLKNPRFKVLKNVVASQIIVHREFGGVVPNLAKRDHLRNLPILLSKLQPFVSKLDFDFIAVTVGPGLEPALWAGIEFGKTLSESLGIPIIGANHLEGHLYSFLLPKPGQNKKVSRKGQPAKTKDLFPAVALIVSGGHTILLKMDSLSKWRRLGETRDDAAGEAFDKVARMLELPYPGGPEIEKLARTGNPQAITFPRPMIHEKNYEFSFSGLKTAVLYYIRDMGYEVRDKFKARFPDSQLQNSPIPQNNSAKRDKPLPPSPTPSIADVAASFQQAAIDVLIAKTLRAAEEYSAQSVILCGGVAANKKLRKDMERAAKNKGLRFLVPEFKYNLDNAAMIGTAGYMAHLRKKKYKFEANGTLEI